MGREKEKWQSARSAISPWVSLFQSLFRLVGCRVQEKLPGVCAFPWAAFSLAPGMQRGAGSLPLGPRCCKQMCTQGAPFSDLLLLTAFLPSRWQKKMGWLRFQGAFQLRPLPPRRGEERKTECARQTDP